MSSQETDHVSPTEVTCCATIWMRTTAIEFEAAAGSAGMIVSIIEVRKLFLLPLDCR